MCYGMIKEERRRINNSEPRLESDKCPHDYYGVDYYERESQERSIRFEVHSGAKVLRAAAAPADRRLPAFRALLSRGTSDDPSPQRGSRPAAEEAAATSSPTRRPSRSTGATAASSLSGARAGRATRHPTRYRSENLERENATKGGAAPAPEPTRATRRSSRDRRQVRLQLPVAPDGAPPRGRPRGPRERPFARVGVPAVTGDGLLRAHACAAPASFPRESSLETRRTSRRPFCVCAAALLRDLRPRQQQF